MKTQSKVVGEPTLYQLKMINSLTHVNYKQEDLYVFEFSLCNDQPDSCFHKFNVCTLDQIRDKCIGSTGYIEIPNDINTYKARIFEAITYIYMRKGSCYVKAFAYIVRTKANQKAIDFIEEHNQKQVNNLFASISFNFNKHVCNICNVNNMDSKCSHIPGEVYDGVRCERTIYDITDFYEWLITEKVTQNKNNDKDTVKPVTELSEGKQHVIDKLIGIVDKDWNNFKVTKDSKYLYSTLKFIEMLQGTV